jgi:hypothetical protein
MFGAIGKNVRRDKQNVWNSRGFQVKIVEKGSLLVVYCQEGSNIFGP